MTPRTSLLLVPFAMAALVASVPQARSEDGARPLTTEMTCAQARSLVEQRGAVVLGTGPFLFDRFVRDVTFCPPRDDTRFAFVRTQDSPRCLIGQTCKAWSNSPR